MRTFFYLLLLLLPFILCILDEQTGSCNSGSGLKQLCLQMYCPMASLWYGGKAFLQSNCHMASQQTHGSVAVWTPYSHMTIWRPNDTIASLQPQDRMALLQPHGHMSSLQPNDHRAIGRPHGHYGLPIDVGSSCLIQFWGLWLRSGLRGTLRPT